MKKIPIRAGQPYEVLMDQGLLDRAGDLIRERTAARWAAVISDETVFSLYGTACSILSAMRDSRPSRSFSRPERGPRAWTPTAGSSPSWRTTACSAPIP